MLAKYLQDYEDCDSISMSSELAMLRIEKYNKQQKNKFSVNNENVINIRVDLSNISAGYDGK